VNSKQEKEAYLVRVELGIEDLLARGIEIPRGPFIQVNVNHDTGWPTARTPAPCICVPTITIILPSGRYRVDEQGKAVSLSSAN
jgi:hypothetical protein